MRKTALVILSLLSLAVMGQSRIASSAIPYPFTAAAYGVATPSAPTVTPTCAGTCATTWGYKVTAYFADGNHTAASAEGTTAANAATLDSTHYNTVTWAAVSGATYYKVYRTTAGTTPSTTGLIATVTNAQARSVADKALAATTATPETTNTTAVILDAGASTAGWEVANDSTTVTIYVHFGSGVNDTTMDFALLPGEKKSFPFAYRLIQVKTSSSTAAGRAVAYLP